MGEQKLKHKKETSAGGIVYKRVDRKLMFLITQHSLHKGWGFPKGLVGDTVADEPNEQAAIREVREEGGVDATIVDPEPVEVKYTYRFKDYLVNKNVFYYLMRYESGSPDDHDWEVSEARFADKDDVEATLTHESDQEAFALIQNKLSSLT